jgi:phage major head subunit gpT-like protein
MTRIRDLANRTNSHWASLLSTLIIAAEAGLCYDGQYFFDTDHSEGSSGSQSNDLTITLSGLPASNAGSTTVPSVEEMQLSIAQCIAQIMSFKDDQGEPMNEDATGFLVMVPNQMYYQSAAQAVATPMQVAASQTVLEAIKQTNTIQVVQNPRLTWTTKFAVFRTDAEVKPFIRQEENAVQLKVKGEGSEFEFDNDAHQYGVDAWRNVGYGFWQMACLATLA